MTEEQNQQQMMPGGLVQAGPTAMDLRPAPDGSVVLYINSMNGAFWFPMDPKAVLPFFENAVKLCGGGSSLIVPNGPLPRDLRL